MSRGARFAIAYVTAVALALGYGIFFPGDGDGLSFLPLVFLAMPWAILVAPIALATDGSRLPSIGILVAGICANAVIAYRFGARRTPRAR